MIPVSHSINSLKHTCQLAGDMEPGDALVCGVANCRLHVKVWCGKFSSKAIVSYVRSSIMKKPAQKDVGRDTLHRIAAIEL